MKFLKRLRKCCRSLAGHTSAISAFCITLALLRFFGVVYLRNVAVAASGVVRNGRGDGRNGVVDAALFRPSSIPSCLAYRSDLSLLVRFVPTPFARHLDGNNTVHSSSVLVRIWPVLSVEEANGAPLAGPAGNEWGSWLFCCQSPFSLLCN